MKRKYFCVLFLMLVLLARVLTTGPAINVMKSIFLPDEENASYPGITIVVDPGHGGRDPGKVGVNDCLEKDINLKIALKLKSLLEERGIKVIMTREEDIGLYSDGDLHKKRSDLNKRIEIINSSDALFAISIHQNSFTEEYIKGAQVFYHTQSEEGKNLALILQDRIKETIADGNHRKAKSNDSYYMMKKTTCPLVIVECGYLSNNNESALLITDEYQEKMAKAICIGIEEYLDNIQSKSTKK
jgi:N-acetylmuramoyl-L-alanine amidase